MYIKMIACGVISCLFPLATDCFADEFDSYLTPSTHIEVAADVQQSYIYGDRIYTPRIGRTVHLSGNGTILEQEGLDAFEAAKIITVGEYTGKDFMEKYRKKFSVKGDSYLVLINDAQAYRRHCNALSHKVIEEGSTKYVFAFSGGKYYTSQKDGEMVVRVNGGKVCHEKRTVPVDSASYGLLERPFTDIEQRGIPFMSFLYRDSLPVRQWQKENNDTSIPDIDKYAVEYRQEVLVDGKKLICYTYFEEPTDQGEIPVELYFFNTKGDLVKYACEVFTTNPIELYGTLYGRDKYKTRVFDVKTISDEIPDKSLFAFPADAKEEKNSFWSLNML